MPAIPAGIDAVVFDFDGTIADTTPSHEQALRVALQPHGLGLDHDWYRRHAGLSIYDLLATLPGGWPLPHDEIIRQSRAYLLATMHSITPIACAVSLLSAARRAGLPCAVASGASRLLVHPGLDALGLRHAFVAVVAREDVTHGKPAPDLYLAAARRLGVPPDRCLAIDDALDGVASARAAGMDVLTIADGHLVPADNGPQGAAQFASPTGTPVPRRTPRGGAARPSPALKMTAAPHHASPDITRPRSEDSAT